MLHAQQEHRKNQAASCVHPAWEQSGRMTVGSLRTSTFCLTLYSTVSTNEPKRPFTALKPSARPNHPLRKFKFTYYADKCPSPVVCDECGHPNFWRAQRRTPKLNDIFLPSSSTALLKGERKCNNVRHETSGNWKWTRDAACFQMYQQQCLRGRQERPLQITLAQLCCILNEVIPLCIDINIFN